MRCVAICSFGKRFITQNKMSPDAFVQMAIVYGYYGLYGDVVAAYEPVLTKVGDVTLSTLMHVSICAFHRALFFL